MRLDERMLKPPSKVFLPIVYAFCQTMRCLAEVFCHSAILPEASGDCEIMPLTLPRSEKKRLSNNPNKRKPQVECVHSAKVRTCISDSASQSQAICWLLVLIYLRRPSQSHRP